MKSFSIDFNWLSKDWGNIQDKATFAEVIISVNGCPVTEVEDLVAKTVRPGIRVSVYGIAVWLASNWWRLRWEPVRNSTDWRMTHQWGAVGGGYQWPDLSFGGDGAMIIVHLKKAHSGKDQLVRYLNEIDQLIPAVEFENEVDQFIQSVIGRLTSLGINQDYLLDLWAELLQERQDEKMTAWRRMEAIVGFDPGEGPDQFIEALHQCGEKYGSAAVEEMAAEFKEKAIDGLIALFDKPRQSAFPVRIPELNDLLLHVRQERAKPIFPWQQATNLARVAREAWGVKSGPIASENLGRILGVPVQTIESGNGEFGPLDAGFRDGKKENISVFLKSSAYAANRRFALLRLVADHLIAPAGDKLLPALKNVRTQRQKFQRAFAQEFLCPYVELEKVIGPEYPSQEDMEDAAQHFGVSPLLIKTILVNKGKVDRDQLVGDINYSDPIMG